MAKDAGMKYMVFTTKHHDGFCNWDTEVTDFKITNPDCPYSQNPDPDIVRQIVNAFRNEGLAVGHYFSHIDWHHPDARQFSETNLGNLSMRETLRKRVDEQPEVWDRFVHFEREQVMELLTGYGPIDIFFFDIWWPWGSYGKPIEHPGVKQDVTDLVTMMREIEPNLIINHRGIDLLGDYSTPENKIPDTPNAGYWETNMTMTSPYRRKGGGFWYKGPDAEAKSMDELLHVMADVFSKGGNFLLNIGPAPDGTFPKNAVTRLRELGEWMDANGEAVYGSHRNPLGYEPEWGRVTVKDQRLYLYVFDWPDDEETLPLRLSNRVESAWILEGQREVNVSMTPGGVSLTLPAEPPHPICSVIAVEFLGDIE